MKIFDCDICGDILVGEDAIGSILKFTSFSMRGCVNCMWKERSTTMKFNKDAWEICMYIDGFSPINKPHRKLIATASFDTKKDAELWCAKWIRTRPPLCSMGGEQ